MGSQPNRSREDTWRRRLVSFHSSGLSVAEFCRREDVSPPSFYQWRKRLGRNPQTSRPSSAAGQPSTAQSQQRFVPVSVSLSAMAEVEFPNGVRIRVPAMTPEILRAAVLAGNDICRGVSQC